MEARKQKIVIVEDDLFQFKILRELLKRDYEILPVINEDDDFVSLTAKLTRFLEDGDQAYFTALGDYEDACAFIVDYELIQGSDTKTGILFCKKADRISEGLIPALIITILSESRITNEMGTLTNNDKKIISSDLRKPEIMNESEAEATVKSIVEDPESEDFRNHIKIRINALVDECKRQNVHTAAP